MKKFMLPMFVCMVLAIADNVLADDNKDKNPSFFEKMQRGVETANNVVQTTGNVVKSVMNGVDGVQQIIGEIQAFLRVESLIYTLETKEQILNNVISNSDAILQELVKNDPTKVDKIKTIIDVIEKTTLPVIATTGKGVCINTYTARETDEQSKKNFQKCLELHEIILPKAVKALKESAEKEKGKTKNVDKK